MFLSRRNSSEVSRAKISPSLDGTLALSFTDCVCTESFCTDFRGLIRWMPSDSVSSVKTRPKSVSTPTLPAGIEVVLHSKTNSTTIDTEICKMREPASRIFGICGIDPPKSVPPPLVTFAIAPSSFCPDLRHRMYHSRPATPPQYLVVFPLDTTAALRHNPAPSLGKKPASPFGQ